MFMDDFYERWLNAAVDPEKDIAEIAETVGASAGLKKEGATEIPAGPTASDAPLKLEPTQ